MGIILSIFWFFTIGLIGGLDCGADLTIYHFIIFGITLVITIYYILKK